MRDVIKNNNPSPGMMGRMVNLRDCSLALPVMLHPYKVIGFVADVFGYPEIVVPYAGRNLGLTRKNPKVFQVLAGNKSISVVVIKCDDVIPGIKRTKERHLELGNILVVHKSGLANRLLPFVFFRVVSRSEERRVGKECRMTSTPDHGEQRLLTIYIV